MADLRPVAAPFVALGPSGVAVRDRLKHLTGEDEKVLRLAGCTPRVPRVEGPQGPLP